MTLYRCPTEPAGDIPGCGGITDTEPDEEGLIDCRHCGIWYPAEASTIEPCATCGTPTDPLDLFPGGVCLACWADSPEGRRMPTARELRAMWGIK